MVSKRGVALGCSAYILFLSSALYYCIYMYRKKSLLSKPRARRRVIIITIIIIVTVVFLAALSDFCANRHRPAPWREQKQQAWPLHGRQCGRSRFWRCQSGFFHENRLPRT